MTYAAYPKDVGAMCWGIFTGDTLFVSATGRTDLSDPAKTRENAGRLYDSIHKKICSVGGRSLDFSSSRSRALLVAATFRIGTIPRLASKETNFVFKASRDEFMDHKAAEKLPRPPYFSHMEKVNLQGGRPTRPGSAARVLQPHEFQKRMKEGVVIDCRPAGRLCRRAYTTII